ncbi:MAG: hypothetical protein WD042_05380 [Phycisphaeraceae bacterium]
MPRAVFFAPARTILHRKAPRLLRRLLRAIRARCPRRLGRGSAQVGQHVQRRQFVAGVAMRVAVHRQRDSGMPRQRLGRLGMHAAVGKVGDERMSQRVEVGHAARCVARGDARRLQVQPQHRRHAVAARQLERRGVGCLSAQHCRQGCRQFGPQHQGILTPPLAVARL